MPFFYASIFNLFVCKKVRISSIFYMNLNTPRFCLTLSMLVGWNLLLKPYT